MKKLVVFYSFEGNTRLIAESIAEEINADILELKPREGTKAKGFIKYFWVLKQLVMQKRLALLPFEKNPQDYDVLFIGSPVWAWTCAPALSAFFSTASIMNKKVALFCCYGGSEGKTLKKMKKSLSNNRILGEISFRQPIRYNKDVSIKRAKEWARNLITSLS